MTELEPVGNQLVIVTLVFGVVALATLSIRIWFRIRSNKYDVSDTCLIAAMVCSFTHHSKFLLTNIVVMWNCSKRHSNYSRRSIRLWQSKHRHSSPLENLYVACEIGIHQPNRLQAYNTPLQAVALLAISGHVLHFD